MAVVILFFFPKSFREKAYNLFANEARGHSDAKIQERVGSMIKQLRDFRQAIYESFGQDHQQEARGRPMSSLATCPPARNHA